MLKRASKVIKRSVNSFGSGRQCYICKKSFFSFGKHHGGYKNLPEFRKKLRMVGSDIDNFRCYYCGSNDRERHLFMYFDAIGLWEKMEGWQILHFAPEKHTRVKIMNQNVSQYIQADLHPRNDQEIAVNATDIQFDNDSFDLIIANHILEHIPAYEKALAEFYRVMKPGGVAIVQTPFSSLLTDNLEDQSIDSDDLRRYFYGQVDHVRTFGQKQLFDSFNEAGFRLNFVRHSDHFTDTDARRFGVNRHEDLLMINK